MVDISGNWPLELELGSNIPEMKISASGQERGVDEEYQRNDETRQEALSLAKWAATLHWLPSREITNTLLPTSRHLPIFSGDIRFGIVSARF